MADNRNIPFTNGTLEKWQTELIADFGKGCKSEEKKYRIFSRYMQILNQMIGLISAKGNEDFINRSNEYMECCYVNGRVFLTFIKGRLQIWTTSGELKRDINGDIEYVDLIPYVSFNSGNYSNDFKTRRFAGSQVVMIKANPQAFGLYFLWNQIIKDNADLMGIYLANSKLNVKKLQYIINNESQSIANEEIAALQDYETPVITTINPIVKASTGDTSAVAGEQNEWRALDLNAGSYDFADVVNHWIFETNLMGLFADEYHKKERNTAGENEMTQGNTVLLHEVILREFKRAENEIKKKFKINVEFYRTFELSVEGGEDNDQDKTEPNTND